MPDDECTCPPALLDIGRHSDRCEAHEPETKSAALAHMRATLRPTASEETA